PNFRSICTVRDSSRRLLQLSKKIEDGFAFAVASDVEGPLLSHVAEPWRNAQGTEHGGVEVFDDDAFLQGLAGAFHGGFAVEISALHAAAEEQDAAGVGEMAVHAVVL